MKSRDSWVSRWISIITPPLWTHKTSTTKFERNRIVHGWVVDDWRNFRRPFSCMTILSELHGQNSTKFDEDISPSKLLKICFAFLIYRFLSKTDSLKTTFALFTQCKFSAEMDKITESVLRKIFYAPIAFFRFRYVTPFWNRSDWGGKLRLNYFVLSTIDILVTITKTRTKMIFINITK